MRRLISSFKIVVNGRPVSPEQNRKAVFGDRDVTGQLRELGLSDKQIFETCHGTNWRTKCDLSSDQEAKLPFLRWKVAATFFWQQTFPSGKEIVVEHAYVPVVGGIYSVPYFEGNLNLSDIPDTREDETNPGCLGEGAKQVIKNRIKSVAAKNPHSVHVTANHVEYILSTGRNWKGPIGEFKLRLKKETPEEIVSVCFPGQPKKLSPTIYEFTEKNFVPHDRLVVYFYNVDKEVHFVR